MMMPPSFPCSLLMCSSAKYVPLITDVCTQKDGQSYHADKNRKYLLDMHMHVYTNFIYLHKYDIFSTLSSWLVMTILGCCVHLTRLTSMVFSQFFSLLMPALLITMSRWPNMSTVFWKASAPKTTAIRRKSITDDIHSSSNNSNKQFLESPVNLKTMFLLCSQTPHRRAWTGTNPYIYADATVQTSVTETANNINQFLSIDIHDNPWAQASSKVMNEQLGVGA